MARAGCHLRHIRAHPTKVQPYWTEVTSTIGIGISIHLHSFDEVSPIAISQGEFRDNNGPLARRVEQVSCRLDAALPTA